MVHPGNFPPSVRNNACRATKVTGLRKILWCRFAWLFDHVVDWLERAVVALGAEHAVRATMTSISAAKRM